MRKCRPCWIAPWPSRIKRFSVKKRRYGDQAKHERRTDKVRHRVNRENFLPLGEQVKYSACHQQVKQRYKRNVVDDSAENNKQHDEKRCPDHKKIASEAWLFELYRNADK